jgi:hypothetical protein
MGTESIGLADALELLLQGRLTPGEFRTRHPSHRTSNELEPVIANIEHYLADADIRASDERYRTMQDATLASLISALRSGDIAAARRISFLGRSD